MPTLELQSSSATRSPLQRQLGVWLFAAFSVVGGIAAYSGTETEHGFRHWFRERLAEGASLVALDAGDPVDGALHVRVDLGVVGRDVRDTEVDRVLELHTEQDRPQNFPRQVS